MFEASNEIFYLSCANFGMYKVQRLCPGKRRLRGLQPLHRGGPITLKEIDSFLDNAGNSKQTFGLIRAQSPLRLAPSQRPRRNPDESGYHFDWKIGELLKGGNGAIREAGMYRRDDLGRRLAFQPKRRFDAARV